MIAPQDSQGPHSIEVDDGIPLRCVLQINCGRPQCRHTKIGQGSSHLSSLEIVGVRYGSLEPFNRLYRVARESREETNVAASSSEHQQTKIESRQSFQLHAVTRYKQASRQTLTKEEAADRRTASKC